MGSDTTDHPGLKLFLVSFLSLFLELMLIRWVPSIFKLVTYYANLLLISSFLGLGLGALWSTRREWIFRLFPVLLGIFAVLLLVTSHVPAPASSGEARFFASPVRLINYIVLITIFVSNASIFVSLGTRIGSLFSVLPSLPAYSFDLAGSLSGTVLFGLFSFFHFSPVLGMGLVMVCYLIITRHQDRIWNAMLFVLIIALVVNLQTKGEYWSPYYYITVYSNGESTSPYYFVPPPDLKTMMNPPLYNVHVNHDFYQVHGTFNPHRYSPLPSFLERIRSGYTLPFILHGPPQKVLVLGSGGGLDAEAAIECGAQQVDAVEIDPMIIKIAKRYSASAIYEDPRVHVVNSDARAVLQSTKNRYDVIVFGRLDSQALFSSMANVRLDGFVYTVESLRAAFNLLKEDGLLCVSFSIPRTWLAQKLYFMMKEATGLRPTVYYRDSNAIFCVSKGYRIHFPDKVGAYQQLKSEPSYVPVATDDWPYLYLSGPKIPVDYAIVIGILLLLSVALIAFFQKGAWVVSDWHFFFLGMGFLLLETKSIVDCSLYFGATWLVTNLVITGILFMVLAANVIASHLKEFSTKLYIPLLMTLVVISAVPRGIILSLPVSARLIWTLIAVPLPVFFAGLIFSTTFRLVKNPALTLGANLIGATLGGFLEYAGMWVGYRNLSLTVIVFYTMSLLVVLRWQKIR
jgi:hypothetical protein